MITNVFSFHNAIFFRVRKTSVMYTKGQNRMGDKYFFLKPDQRATILVDLRNKKERDRQKG